MDDAHFIHLLKLASVNAADRHLATVLSGHSRDAAPLEEHERRRFCDRDLEMALESTPLTRPGSCPTWRWRWSLALRIAS